MNTVQKEPLLTAGTAVGILGAALIVLQKFHVPISDDQVTALKNFFVVAGPVLLALIARQWVWSSPNHDAAVADAIETTGVVKASTTTPAIAAPGLVATSPVTRVEAPPKEAPVPVAVRQTASPVMTDVTAS
ncbi:MAG TPA: hypothetical protein VFQ54_08650 [Thermomicrobiales bacterium]|nr:hypothetical protein [Thermomicrobiales bacterium]